MPEASESGSLALGKPDIAADYCEPSSRRLCASSRAIFSSSRACFRDSSRVFFILSPTSSYSSSSGFSAASLDRAFTISPLVQYDLGMRTKMNTSALVTACLVVALAASCGGNKSTANTTSTANTSTTKPPLAAAFKAVFSAPSHHPVVNKNWPITVTVTNLSGRPIAASLYMQVLYGGLVVGPIDGNKKGRAKIYHFVGRHHENIVWPVASIGHPLTLQSVVTVKGKTKKLLWALSVVRK